MERYKLKIKTYMFINMEIKPTSAYKIHEFITYMHRNLLHVSATFCGHLEVCVVSRVCYKDVTSSV